MKTAKELCEESKNRLVDKVITDLKSTISLTREYRSHTLQINRHPEWYFNNYIVDKYHNNVGLITKLKELGYKVEFETKLEIFKNAKFPKDTKIIVPGIKILGITLKKERTRYETEWIAKDLEQEVTIMTVSACCGEEHEKTR